MTKLLVDKIKELHILWTFRGYQGKIVKHSVLTNLVTYREWTNFLRSVFFQTDSVRLLSP